MGQSQTGKAARYRIRIVALPLEYVPGIVIP